jgi:hypothetical protein
VSERSAKIFSQLVIICGLLYFAYAEIMICVNAYMNPSKSLLVKVVPELVLPGLLICASAIDLTTSNAFAPFPVFGTPTFFGDPRISLRPFWGDALTSFPQSSAPNHHIPSACCLSSDIDFMGSCFTQQPACPVNARFRPNQFGYSSLLANGFSIQFDCMDYAPGIKFTSNTQSLWMPYQLLTDYGVLAWDNSTGNSSYVTGSYSNSDDPSTDEAYALYMQNLVYWPAKLLFMSYLPSENNSNPIDLYYGRLDTAETLQTRIRLDMERGITSIQLGRYAYIDWAGNTLAAQSGLSYYYDLTVPALPWASAQSKYNPYRQLVSMLGWTQIRPNFYEVDTVEIVLFTYINLITTFLSIIGASEAIINFLIGPGEYDPKGLINKIFYRDVPTFKQTKSDVVIDKKKLAADQKAHEEKMQELKAADMKKNAEAVAGSGLRIDSAEQLA